MALGELLELILEGVDAEVASLVRQRWRMLQDDPDLDGLHRLSEALQDYPDEYPAGWWLDPVQCRYWLSLHIDWKAANEVEWQVQAIAHTLGLNPGFVGLAVRPGVMAPEVLSGAAAWLRPQGVELMLLDTGGDEYLCVPISLGRLREAFGVADRLRIRTSLL